MINFSILRQSKRSRARVGILKTPHGEVETPAFVTVATQAAIKALIPEEAYKANVGIAIANTFHLHLKPGEKIIAAAGGLHAFMNWSRPLMTDSGGFQVFSLGFGRELGVGKMVKYFPDEGALPVVERHHQPQSVKITDDGVEFRSPIDGAPLFIGPKESIKIQESLGADIIFAFDECTPPLSTEAYAARSLDRTIGWAKICRDSKKSDQALFGIVQGSQFKELRQKSADAIARMEFDGYGIGGDLGNGKETLSKILNWVVPRLDPSKPRHLLGVGHPEDFKRIIRGGVDLFDCIAPTHYARRGIAFTSAGRLDISRKAFLRDKKPLDPRCDCMVCGTYRRNYLSHLVRAKEITAMHFLTFHNLYFFNLLAARIRDKIKAGTL